MDKQPVVVTGMGVICPLGLNVKEFWAGLVAGKSGISYITRFDTSNYLVKVAGEVTGFDPTKYMDIKTVECTRRAIHFAIPAVKEAVESARLDMTKEPGGASRCYHHHHDGTSVYCQWVGNTSETGAEKGGPAVFYQGSP